MWCGFRSNTYLLQQAGWEIAAEQDFASLELQLIMRHQDLKLYAITERTRFDFYQNARSNVPPPVFRVIHAAPMLHVLQLGQSVLNYRQIDAAPQITNMEYRSIEDLGIFAVPLARTEEIIVEPADVSALLEQIRKMQAPEQAEIRARQRSRERAGENPLTRPSQQFHAQIISFNKARQAA